VIQEIYTCPQCGRRLQAPGDLAGLEVQCAACGTTFVARRSEPPAPSPRPPQRPYLPLGPGFDDDDDDRDRRGRRDLPPHRGALILTLGVISLVGLVLVLPGLVLGLITVILANVDLGAIRSGRMDPEGEAPTANGRTCGWVAVVLAGLLVLGCGCLGLGDALTGHSDFLFDDF
jgi:hypothetical protein